MYPLVSIHTCAHTHTHIYTHIDTYTHIYTPTHAQTHARRHTHTRTHTHTHTHAHTHTLNQCHHYSNEQEHLPLLNATTQSRQEQVTTHTPLLSVTWYSWTLDDRGMWGSTPVQRRATSTENKPHPSLATFCGLQRAIKSNSINNIYTYMFVFIRKVAKFRQHNTCKILDLHAVWTKLHLIKKLYATPTCIWYLLDGIKSEQRDWIDQLYSWHEAVT